MLFNYSASIIFGKLPSVVSGLGVKRKREFVPVSKLEIMFRFIAVRLIHVCRKAIRTGLTLVQPSDISSDLFILSFCHQNNADWNT